MGEVYLAQDTRLDRLVAIKLLPAELTNDLSRLRRFEQEARAVSALNHPNIVTIFEIGEAPAGRFIVLEYVKGQTLRSIIGGRQGLAAIPPVGRQAATALAVAHGAGMIHRDIKPENVMVRDDGYVKVLDFGLARLSARDGSSESTADTAIHTKPGIIIGTVAYMSPEQIKGDTVTAATDVFSLGVVFFEMATGRKPFRSGSEMAVMYQIVHDRAAGASDAQRRRRTRARRDDRRDAGQEPAAPADGGRCRGGPGREPRVDCAAAPIASRADTGSTVGRNTVGRSAEHARIADAFQAAASGHGAIICVTGEAGIGKTTLVEDFLSPIRDAEPACAIARGRCSERPRRRGSVFALARSARRPGERAAGAGARAEGHGAVVVRAARDVDRRLGRAPAHRVADRVAGADETGAVGVPPRDHDRACARALLRRSALGRHLDGRHHRLHRHEDRGDARAARRHLSAIRDAAEQASVSADRARSAGARRLSRRWRSSS
jgi:hypothetical protein